MCLSCGCGEPDADHGDERHITRARLREGLTDEKVLAAAEAAEISPEEVRQNIEATKG
jgi:hypothetical protein